MATLQHFPRSNDFDNSSQRTFFRPYSLSTYHSHLAYTSASRNKKKDLDSCRRAGGGQTFAAQARRGQAGAVQVARNRGIGPNRGAGRLPPEPVFQPFVG
jgi:hypothetical protein